MWPTSPGARTPCGPGWAGSDRNGNPEDARVHWRSAWSCPSTLGPAQPQGRLGVAGHAPVAARRQADRTDLGAVRQAGPFELVTKETSDERLQPLAQLLRG